MQQTFVDARPASATARDPVVISAPHGGDIIPLCFSDRISGCTECDWNSWELAEAAWEAFDRPALVGLRLSRLKLDANRARCFACDDEAAFSVHDEYHSAVEAACAAAVERFGWCLHLDLHGQSHRPATELGYLLTSEDFLMEDAALDAAPRESSVELLLSGPPESGRRRSALTRGATSLGALLEARGFPCVPSPRTPAPVEAAALEAARKAKADIGAAHGPPAEEAAAATYFWGGYTVRRLGVPASIPPHCGPLPEPAQGGWARRVASVSLETAWAVREGAADRERFAAALAEATREFVREWSPAPARASDG